MKRALVLSLIFLLGLGFSTLAASLTGSWDTDVKILPQQTNFNDALGLKSVLKVDYMVGDWTFGSITTLTEDGWTDQDFSVTGVLGAFSLTSKLGFIPFNTYVSTSPYLSYPKYDAPEFDSWVSTAAVSIAGVSFSAKLSLWNPGDWAFPLYDILGNQTNSKVLVGAFCPSTPDDRGNDLSLELKGSGVAGDVTFAGTLTFGAPNEYYYSIGGPVFGWDGTKWNVIPGINAAVVAGNSITYGTFSALVFVPYDNTTTKYTSFKMGEPQEACELMFKDAECDLDWTGISITIGFPFCCADITSKIAFDCDGFDYASFTAKGIVIPNLPWVTLDTTVKFTTLSKTLTLSPTFDFGVMACFDLWISVDENPLTAGRGWTFNSLSIDGISLTCDIGAVTFTGASYWGTPRVYYEHPFYFSATNDMSAYWEYYKIATKDDGCCGPFGFDLSVWFLDSGNNLFDLGLVEANMTLQVASQFTFNMGLKVDVDAGNFSEWTVGFLVTW